MGLRNSNAVGGLCFMTFQTVGATSERKMLSVLCMSITEIPKDVGWKHRCTLGLVPGHQVAL